MDIKVSIIIPCYNAKQWVAETIASCLHQTYKDLEIIVVDDGSSDGSLSIIKHYEQTIKIESGPNRGANHARNRGLQLATGKYVKFLDSDDLIEPNAIAAQIEALVSTNADVCYGDWRHMKCTVSGDEKFFPVIKAGPNDNILESLLNTWWGASFVYLFKRDFLLRHNCTWNTELKISQDFDFLLQVALHGASFCYVPFLIGSYRHHRGLSITNQGLIAAIEANKHILTRTEEFLFRNNRLTIEMKNLLSGYYLSMAKAAYAHDIVVFRGLINEVNRLSPNFKTKKNLYDFTVRLLGYEKSEWIWEQRRKILNVVNRDKEYYER